jgi:murein DD-endopeptidase MepM/ murein hydrolase activator NlpD
MARINSSGWRWRRAVLVLLAAVVMGGTHAADTTASARQVGYGWPIKPFHRQHPVRGSFGDPRTVFSGPPTLPTLMQGAGSFRFHEGVDISAANGTPVYPVESGTVIVVEKTEDWHVEVSAGGGVSFDYWHIKPSVRVGERVAAFQTILGHIERPAEHVHLAERIGGIPVNPLAAGRLTPYRDTTPPRVDSIAIRALDIRGGGLPNFLRGRVEMTAEAYDTPTLAAPGRWSGMPITPTRVSWRVQGLGGRVVVPETVVVDFRSRIPADGSFWSYYARGTYQNMSVFGQHYSWREPGSYVFKLTPQPFDTKQVRDGVYDLVVTATDIRGNHGSRSRRITIHNRSGWAGS